MIQQQYMLLNHIKIISKSANYNTMLSLLYQTNKFNIKGMKVRENGR